MLDTLNECLKQLQPARSHNVDTQLGMFRSIKPSTLSGWLISSDHMITTLSQFPVLLVFVQPQPAGCSFCSLQHCSSVLFPTMPLELNVIHTGKLRQPTSTGNSQVCHPHSIQSLWVCVLGCLHFICTPPSNVLLVQQ